MVMTENVIQLKRSPGRPKKYHNDEDRRLVAARRRSAATMSAFYCYFFLGAANLDLLRDVLSCDLYCLTRDTEDSYTAMRMPRTTVPGF